MDHRRLTRIVKQSDGGITVEHTERPGDELAFMVHSPDMSKDSTLPDQVGRECDSKDGFKVNLPFYSTTPPGVFAAGDYCSYQTSILIGVSAGSCAAVGLARKLPFGGAWPQF
jgi:gliotoxin/aspirochlorine biosynthesis thioredoxin reductase